MKCLKIDPLCVLVLALAFAIAGCQFYHPNPSSNQFVEMYSNSSKIPDGFSSYTLFLVPEYSVKLAYTKEQWSEIRYYYVKLGESIKEENAAVWIHDSDENAPSVERSREIIGKINTTLNSDHGHLDYGKSPIVLFATYNPELNTKRTDQFYTAIQLDCRDSQIIIRFFDKLAQLIREKRIDRTTLEREQFVMELYECLQSVATSVGLKVGPISVKLHTPTRNN